MKEKICLWVVTNKNIKGEDKKAGYYSSYYLPALMSAKGIPVYVVDIHDDRNTESLYKGRTDKIFGYRIDENYAAATLHKYKEETTRIIPEDVSMVVPYASSEVDVTVLEAVSRIFKNNIFVGSPGSLAVLNSKQALERIRLDPRAKHFARHILPVRPVRTVDDYKMVKSELGGDIVLKAPRSTEGVGIYIDRKGGSELELNGGIEKVLGTHKELIATPYYDIGSNGDTRIFGYGEKGACKVLPYGAQRIAAKPTAENPYPKCNVSSGATCNVVKLTRHQEEIALLAAEYYSSVWGVPHIGLDMFGNGNDRESLRISEVNNSPDGHSYVDKSYPEKVSEFYAGQYRKIMNISQRLFVVKPAKAAEVSEGNMARIAPVAEAGNNLEFLLKRNERKASEGGIRQ